MHAVIRSGGKQYKVEKGDKLKVEKLDKEEILEAIDNLSNNNGQIEQELDRFFDIFKRVKAEQEVDALRKRIETLFSNQKNIDR